MEHTVIGPRGGITKADVSCYTCLCGAACALTKVKHLGCADWVNEIGQRVYFPPIEPGKIEVSGVDVPVKVKNQPPDLTAGETRKLTAKEKNMPDNFGRMTSDEAPQSLKDFCFPKHTPGPWTIYNHAGTDSGHYDGYLKSDIRAGADLIHIRQSKAGNTFQRLAANVRLIAAAPSMHDALWAIANMQVQEETDKGEVLALCKSIALLMKITDMDDWEIITRTVFSEWLRGLETEAKARVYKAAVDQLADSMAAGAWQDGPAPKDGSWILGLFHGLPYVVAYDSWEVSEEGGPKETEEGWCLAGQDMHPMDKDEPEKWARIIHPDRHMPASWDGPGDCS